MFNIKKALEDIYNENQVLVLKIELEVEIMQDASKEIKNPDILGKVSHDIRLMEERKKRLIRACEIVENRLKSLE